MLSSVARRASHGHRQSPLPLLLKARPSDRWNRGKFSKLWHQVELSRSTQLASQAPLPARTLDIGVLSSDKQQRPLLSCTIKALGLQTFSKDELEATFKLADKDGSGELTRQELVDVFRRVAMQKEPGRPQEEEDEECAKTGLSLSEGLHSSCPAQVLASRLLIVLDHNKDERVTFAEFHKGLTKMAEERDSRMWTVACSMMITGVSVGVIVPAMPMLAQQLALSEAQFGYIVSAFGLSKLLANVPAGMCVDSKGRRTAMVTGLLFNAAGMLGIGLASSVVDLIGARFVAGIGASFVVAGAMTSVADISTPLNRARMLAPVMAGFSAGTVLGPAVGGSLLGSIGLTPTCEVVAGILTTNALVTRYLMSETKPDDAGGSHGSLSTAVREMFAQWAPIWNHPEMRTVFLVNTAYWVALAGCNMTLLPLLLANQFGLSAAQIGMAFAMSSTVSVLAASPAATLADRFGPARMFAPSFILTALPMAALPLASNMTEAGVAIVLMSLGNVGLASTPSALISNLASSKDRAQALALTRTMGDVGWLMGGVSIGAIASAIGTGPALGGTAGFLLTVAAWLATAARLPR